MCELLGMECNVPTDIVFSFTGFALRGGKTGPHADGWGLALYDGKFARSFLEPTPACTSAHGATFIRRHPIKTLLAIAHVRRRRAAERRWRTRTRSSASCGGGTSCSRTTAPCRDVQAAPAAVESSRSARPTASTRSAALLEQLRAAFPDGYPKQPRRLWQAIAELGAQLGARGHVQLPARRRAPPVRALRDQALLHRAQGAVRARDAADDEIRSTSAAVTTRERSRRRGRDRAADARRAVAAGNARHAVGVRSAARCGRPCPAATGSTRCRAGS